MPLYDYRCAGCGREVEVMHGIYDGGPATCEHCGGALRKALSPPAIHFKGSGWAKKDAAASAKKATSKAASTAGSKSTSTAAEGSKTASPEKTASGSSSPSSERGTTSTAKSTAD